MRVHSGAAVTPRAAVRLIYLLKTAARGIVIVASLTS